ncbi:hypothetical protein, partial [Ileibacterium valens]
MVSEIPTNFHEIKSQGGHLISQLGHFLEFQHSFLLIQIEFPKTKTTDFINWFETFVRGFIKVPKTGDLILNT